MTVWVCPKHGKKKVEEIKRKHKMVRNEYCVAWAQEISTNCILKKTHLDTPQVLL